MTADIEDFEQDDLPMEGLDRTPRELEGRDSEQYPDTWTPVSKLPQVPTRPGWRHYFKRVSINGSKDDKNMSIALQEGWRPCKREDYPELSTHMMRYGDGDSTVIEFGGLVLCRMPEELAKQRDSYYEQRALRQVGAVNQRLKSVVNEGGLAIHNRSKSTVSKRPF